MASVDAGVQSLSQKSKARDPLATMLGRIRAPLVAIRYARRMPTDEDAIIGLLRAWNEGDAAAFDKLAPFGYAELRKLAPSNMLGERPGHTLQPTALVTKCIFEWSSSVCRGSRTAHISTDCPLSSCGRFSSIAHVFERTATLRVLFRATPGEGLRPLLSHIRILARPVGVAAPRAQSSTRNSTTVAPAPPSCGVAA